jgi:hypothetical protein
MAKPTTLNRQTSEWNLLYQKALRATGQALGLPIADANRAMARRFDELGWQQTEERWALLTGLKDFHVLRVALPYARRGRY